MKSLRVLNATVVIILLLSIIPVQAAPIPQGPVTPETATHRIAPPVLPTPPPPASMPPADVDETLAPGAEVKPAVREGYSELADLASLPNATIVLDDFNRADGPIGTNWTVHDGYCNVSSGAAVCGSNGRATFNAAPGYGDMAEADVAVDGTALQYTGLLLNYGAGVSNLFLKVQQQSPYAGQFTHAACRIGVNDGTTFGLGFFALNSHFSTAHMKARRIGSDVTIEFTNIDGGAQPDQVYVCSGAPPPEGAGVGIVGYAGIARLDNFGVPGDERIAWDKTIDGLPWTPGISITRQTSDTIMVQEVLHLGATLLAGSMPFVPVNIEGQAGETAPMPSLSLPTPSSPARAPGKPTQALRPKAVLWDQPLSTVNQAAYVNQDFPDDPTHSSFLADDFVNAAPWRIETIFVPGDGWNGFTTLLNATALTWQIYADSVITPGIPAGDPSGGGSPPVWTLTLPPTDTQVIIGNGTPGGLPSDTTLNLAAPLNLPAGHWWLVFYPTMEFGLYGQHGRQPADTTNGYVGQFINPGGGFGYGTAWQNWTVLGPTQPDMAFRLEGTVGQSPRGARLYLTSLDIGDTTFAVYDPAADAWTPLKPYETGCQMAVSRLGQLYAYGYTTGSIDRYDAADDTWMPVMPAPPGASGAYCNLEITNAGEFLYTESSGTTLWYTAGGVWNTLALPFTTNAMGDYDPTAGQYVIGEYGTTNAHMIDLHTWAITDFASPVPNGETARFSVVMGGRYYFHADTSNIHSFDLSNPALPPLDHGVSPGWYTSAAGDRSSAVIYSAGLDGTTLNRFDPATNTLAPLAGYGAATWHSSVAYVPLIYSQVETWNPAHLRLLDWAASGGDVRIRHGIIYGAANVGWGPSTLYTLDPATGVAAAVGPVGLNHVTGMDFDPLSGVLYGVGNRPSDGTWILLTIDPTTGAGSEVCPITPWPHPYGNSISDISFRGDGVLYAYLESGDGLGTLDTATCTLTPLGPTNTSDTGNGIGFTPGDTLYHANEWSLNTLDQATGNATLVTTMAYPPGVNPRLSALGYDPASGAMYGALVEGSGGDDFNALARVDLATGAVTRIGQSVTGLGALAIRPVSFLQWSGEIVTPTVITLTKWFHVEPCTWTQTLLWEKLWLSGVELEQRPVVVNKLPPLLGISSAYSSTVWPGAQAQFTLAYSNTGGYENNVMVRNEFPPEALFVGSVPPPDAADPGGMWAEWLVGDLPMGAMGSISVTVNIADTILPGQLITITDWIINHLGDPVDVTEIVFEAGPGEPDIRVIAPPLEMELCPDQTASVDIQVCNDGNYPLKWMIAEAPPPTTTLSALRPAAPIPTRQAALVSSNNANTFPQVESKNHILANPVLIIQDQNPWGYTSIQDILTANSIAYDQVDSSQIPTIDLSPYKLVIIPSNQPGSFYTTWNANLPRFEAYAAAGGALWLSTCAYSLTSPEPLVPGGVINSTDLDNYNDIVAPTHPWVAGAPNPMYGNYASHDSFANLYPGSAVVARAQTSLKPTLVDYRMGMGRILITGQPLEFAWANGWDGAPILQNSLLDMYAWAPFDVPWLTETPHAGAVWMGECQTVTVGFDSTGLLPSDYFADLSLLSNDPDTPQITLPVTLTVEPPEIVLAPPAVQVEMCPEATAAQTFEICNPGHCPLEWTINEAPGLLSSFAGDWGLNRREPDRSGNAINGVASDGPAPASSPAAPAASPLLAGATVINFDDAAQPCSFVSTVALRNQYAGHGVLFMGPAPLDGGGVLDECSNFGISGYSAPNFLAFNTASSFSDGGIPRPPQIITFTHRASHVQVNAGSNSGAGHTITMEAFDAGGNSLGSDSLTLTTTLNTLSIAADNIAYVVINTPAQAFVLDDLVIFSVDIPWLSESPITGTVAPGACQTVTVNFDSTGLLPGLYTANLVVNSNDPDTPQVTLPVTLTVKGVVTGTDFTWSPDPAFTYQDITFTGWTSTAGTITYTWDFGDGVTGSGITTTHAYTLAGDHVVTLAASNGCNQQTVTHTVTVICVPLEGITISGPITGYVGTTYNFSTHFTPTNASGPIYLWNNGATTPDANYNFGAPGPYTIIVTATNCTNVTVTDTHEIVISTPPACTGVTGVDLSVTTAGTIYTDTAVAFSADLLPDDAETPFHYRITMDGAPGAAIDTSVEPIVFNHTFDTTGTHTVDIAVWNCFMNEADAVTDTIQVMVYEQGVCVPLESITIGGATGGAPGSHTFTTSHLPTDASLPIEYLWDNGDTTASSTRAMGVGAHTLAVTATNCTSAVVTDTHQITITSCTEITSVDLNVTTAGAIYTNTVVAFSAAILPANLTTPYTYTINGGPELSSSSNPLAFTLTFSAVGTHTVTIAVWNCAMATPATDSVDVVVAELPSGYLHIYLPVITRS